jgi:NitT/TauT family transport system substrate-binding protein
MEKRKRVSPKRITASIIIILVIFSGIFLYTSYQTPKNHEEEGGTTQVTEPTPVPASPDQIFIGVVPWIGWAPLVVAEEKGFFKDEGLDVKVIVFPDATSRYNAFEAGNIHFSTGDIGDFALQAAEGYSASIIMQTHWSYSLMFIIENEFKDLSELKGRIITCEKGGVDFFFLTKALERYGLTIDDVTIIDMTAPEGAEAFIKGTVNATVGCGTETPLIIREGKGKTAITSKDFQGIDPVGLYAQNKFLEENPDTVVKVLRAYFKALRWSEEHPDEYYEIANEKLFYRNPQTKEDLIYSQSLVKQLRPEEIKREMEGGGPLYGYCQEVLDFYFDQGVIDSKPDPSSFINNELYLKALEDYEEDYE